VKQTYTLITGASSGIGMELSKVAARDGHSVILVARSKHKLTELARSLTEQHEVHTEVISLDLTERDAAQSLHRTLKRKNLDVDILINNAGFGDYGAFSVSNINTQLSMIDLNIRALTELTHLLLPSIQKNHGRIMNVASVAGFLPGPMMSVYFATKAYVLSFSEALSEELRGSGVTVTCLAPGSTKTDFGENANASLTHSTRTSNVSAMSVAEFGWKSMLKGRSLAVHGITNRLVIFLKRFLPRRLITALVHHMQR
jgi:short-subunit dehydrogenase